MTAELENVAPIKDKIEKSEIIYIKIDTIIPNRAQPREIFDESGIQELASSIKSHGIIQPLTVREYPSKSNFSHYKYELIAGERRLRASKLLGMREIPCIVIKADCKTSAELAIIENLHRKDLNMFEEASAIASIIEIHALTQEQIAQKLSITQAAVANKLRILRLSEEEKSILIKNNLSERHARAILRIKDQDLREKALKHIVSKMFNVKQSEEYIDNLLSGPETKDKKQPTMDIPLLLSNIERSIQATRYSGKKIKTQHAETDEEIILTICISK